MSSHRIGLLVPSSNTTMETELPEVLRRTGALSGERFTFHSARMRMKTVEPSELAAMNVDAERATIELADAAVDVMAYACLVAVMAEGVGAHPAVEARLTATAAAAGDPVDVVSSAGALIESLHYLGVTKTAIVAPYVKQLTTLVIDYIEADGIQVHDAISLEVDDNLAVGRLDPRELPEIATRLDTRGVDAVVLSACVQMPSLAAIPHAEKALGMPVITAATATSWKVLRSMGLPAVAEGSGALLRAVA
ncbi:Maleate isomerase [Mycobacterium simulans]|uniref:Maleate isomerase n=1 Tax=Mycobacterium simulans TaxID=627089 RepID=A0A7Z7IG27_9MYCO|nr:Asp/Glu racemase [Mycobacterium simulans]SOJ52761.1 Maleate isomerase [Mycobacterium simulans]